MSPGGAALLVAGGFVAGLINTIAGGGSLLTLPLLVMTGLPGGVANATNRVAVLIQSTVGAWRFGAEGVPGARAARPLLLPLVVGAAIGAVLVSRMPDHLFERVFAVLMLVLLVPALKPLRTPTVAKPQPRFSPGDFALFFLIGLYGGAFQAGVGILLVLALARAGHDLVLANSIKLVVVAAFTAVAVVIFLVQGQVVWLPALVLAVSQALGAAVGARVVVRGGERIVRPIFVFCVLALAGRMLRLY